MSQKQDLYEALSRKASGELSEDEARALDERTREDRALEAEARAFDRMLGALSDLPEIAPPPALDDLVLGRTRREPQRSRRPLVAALAVGLAAAAAALVVQLPGQDLPAKVTLARGDQIVEGRAEITADGVEIALDGRARISVEPLPPPTREPHPEIEEMKIIMSGVGGAALGAIVTVAVLDGDATVTGRNGEVATLSKGEKKVITPPSASNAAFQIAEGASPAERIAALESEVDTLRQKLAEAEFTGAVARGQIARAQGEPSPWPSDVDPSYLPAAFEENLRAEIAKIPGLALHQLDCEEYPCVATLLGKDLDGDLEEKLKALPESLTASTYAGAGVWMGLAKMETDAGVQSAAGLALMPGGHGVSDATSDAIRTRTDFRAGNLLRDLESSLEGGEAP